MSASITINSKLPSWSRFAIYSSIVNKVQRRNIWSHDCQKPVARAAVISGYIEMRIAGSGGTVDRVAMVAHKGPTMARKGVGDVLRNERRTNPCSGSRSYGVYSEA